jgi:hypothetical protein
MRTHGASWFVQKQQAANGSTRVEMCADDDSAVGADCPRSMQLRVRSLRIDRYPNEVFAPQEHELCRMLRVAMLPSRRSICKVPLVEH